MGNYLFDIKKKIVLAGDSEIFKNWSEHSTITVDDFLKALEWVCEDEFDEQNRRTRWIGLEPNRIVRLKACYGRFYGFPVWYINIDDPIDEAGKRFPVWDGKFFEDGFLHKIMLSARDKV